MCIRDRVGKTHFYPQRLHLGFEENILYEIPVWHRNFESDYHRWLQKETNGSVKDVAREHDPNTFVVHPWNHAEYLHPTNWTTSQAIESLARRDPTRPFFLQVGYHRPHTPYDPPAAYWEKYKNLEMAPPPIGDWCGEYSGETHSLTMHHGDIGDAMRDDMRRGYYASVSHMDYEVGKLFYSVSYTHLDVYKRQVIFWSNIQKVKGQFLKAFYFFVFFPYSQFTSLLQLLGGFFY